MTLIDERREKTIFTSPIIQLKIKASNGQRVRTNRTSSRQRLSAVLQACLEVYILFIGIFAQKVAWYSMLMDNDHSILPSRRLILHPDLIHFPSPQYFRLTRESHPNLAAQSKHPAVQRAPCQEDSCLLPSRSDNQSMTASQPRSARKHP